MWDVVVKLPFVICVTFWIGLFIVLMYTFVGNGAGQVIPKLLHLVGNTDKFGEQSLGLAFLRLSCIAVVTLVLGYLTLRSRRAR